MLIDTENRLMVARGGGWWVEEMGELFLFFGFFFSLNVYLKIKASTKMHKYLITWTGL